MEVRYETERPLLTKRNENFCKCICISINNIDQKFSIVSEHGKNPAPSAYLFYSHSKGIHSKISERGVNKQLCKYAQKAHSVCSEVPEAVHTHQFRHSMATHCLDDGMNIFQISKMLGHKSVHTTMTYLGVTVAMTESAIKKIESSTVQTIKPKWKSGMKLKDLF